MRNYRKLFTILDEISHLRLRLAPFTERDLTILVKRAIQRSLFTPKGLLEYLEPLGIPDSDIKTVLWRHCEFGPKWEIKWVSDKLLERD